MITPGYGYKVDPTNPNGVVRDVNVDLSAGAPIPDASKPASTMNVNDPVFGSKVAPTVNTPSDLAANATAKATGTPVAPAGQTVAPLATPVGAPPKGTTGVPRVNVAPGYYQDETGKISPVNPPAGYHRNPDGTVVADTAPIKREIYAPGTVQNTTPSASSTSTSSIGGGAGMDNRTQAEKDASSYLDTSFQAPKSEEQIVTERTAAAKDRIAALNDYYASQKANLAPLNEMRTREANAQAVLRGLSGSSEAGTLTETALAKNAAASNAIAAEHAMKMADLYSGIQDFAHNEAIRQKTEATSNAKDVLARGETARKVASDHLITIAKNPSFNLDAIKANDPTTYNQLAQSVGGEDIMKGIVFANRPASSIVGTPTIVGGYIHQMVKQPDGTITHEYVPVPKDVLASDPKNNKTVKTDNGTFVSSDGGKTYTPLANSMKPVTTKTTKGISPDLISQGSQKLSATRGPDGYVDPNVYQKAFQDWVKGTDTHAPIGTAKEFLAHFPPKDYVNPANTFLPDYLMPAGKKKAVVAGPY